MSEKDQSQNVTITNTGADFLTLETTPTGKFVYVFKKPPKTLEHKFDEARNEMTIKATW